MRPEQQEVVNRASRLSWYRPTPPRTTQQERQTFATWFKAQSDLRRDSGCDVTNTEMVWCGLCLLGQRAGYQSHLPVTDDNLNAIKASSEFGPLFERVEVPKLTVPTAEEVTKAVQELAGLEPKWNGVYETIADERGVRREIVSYNSPDNIQKLVNAICDSNYPAYAFGVASGETFLQAFKKMVSYGHLTAIRKPDKPTHNPPATPASIRAAREADANKHADTRQSVKELRDMRERFKADYDTVRDFHGTGMSNGLRSYAAKYAGQKAGLAQLKAKWDGKFQGDDLKGYNKMVADLERDIQKLSPSGGTIKINTKDDKPNEYRGGGTITDVPVTADAEAARQEHNRQLLGGNVTNPKKPVSPANV